MTGETSHPSPELTAAYLDRTLSEGESSRFEEHLASCRRCRAEVVALRRVIAQRGGRRRWAAIAVTVGAAAAALVILLPGASVRPPARPDTTVVRASGAGQVGGLDPIGPRADAPVRRSALRFSWRAGGADQYRVTVADEGGQVLWSSTTEDTVIEPPGSLRLEPGREYYWYVDGRRPDGAVASTGAQEFRISP